MACGLQERHGSLHNLRPCECLDLADSGRCSSSCSYCVSSLLGWNWEGNNKYSFHVHPSRSSRHIEHMLKPRQDAFTKTATLVSPPYPFSLHVVNSGKALYRSSYGGHQMYRKHGSMFFCDAEILFEIMGLPMNYTEGFPLCPQFDYLWQRGKIGRRKER